MSNNPPYTFLLGAGAVIDWGGPKTLCDNDKLSFLPEHLTGELENRVCCLTHLIRSIGFFTKKGERITELIYRILLTNGFKKEKINFETIINTIEELLVYFSNFDKEDSGSILSSFFTAKPILDEIFNFNVIGQRKHGYQLNIPEFSHIDRPALNNETPKQFFLQLLLLNIFDGIIGHTSKYSYYTDSHQTVVENEINDELNNAFYSWMRIIDNQNISIRTYTLNYDRLFKVILKKRGITLFEGFEHDNIQPGKVIQPALDKIYSDIDSHVYYNLHGSAYWDIETTNYHQLPDYIVTLKGVPSFTSNLFTPSIKQIEKGKNLLLTNIITGYQKVQRTSFPPFKQMQASFDRDCLRTNKIYIVGYSWDDEHINESIRTALKFNPDLKIVIIDPSFIAKELDYKVGIKVFSSSYKQLKPRNDAFDKSVYHYLDDSILVYNMSFKKYLLDKKYKTIFVIK